MPRSSLSLGRILGVHPREGQRCFHPDAVSYYSQSKSRLRGLRFSTTSSSLYNLDLMYADGTEDASLAVEKIL